MAEPVTARNDDDFGDFGLSDDDFRNIDIESAIQQSCSKNTCTDKRQLLTEYTQITPKRKNSASSSFLPTTFSVKKRNSRSNATIYKVRNANSGRVGIPLQVYRNGRVWVSDIMAQMWCEQQMVYRFDPPPELVMVPIVEAPEIKVGSSIHLARELEIQEVVTVKITSAEDRLALKVVNLMDALHSLLELGAPVRREIPVFGAPFGMGVFVVGCIDELRCQSDTLSLELVEFKTRCSKEMPPHAQAITHNLQMMLYKRMFDEMVRGLLTKKDIATHMRVNLQRTLGEEMREHIKTQNRSSGDSPTYTLDRLLDSLFELMPAVPFLSDTLTVQYEYQLDNTTIGESTVDYDEVWLHAELTRAFQFWNGERQAVGVDIEDLWKCRRCHYDGNCAWQKDKIDAINLRKMAAGATDVTVEGSTAVVCRVTDTGDQLNDIDCVSSIQTIAIEEHSTGNDTNVFKEQVIVSKDGVSASSDVLVITLD